MRGALHAATIASGRATTGRIDLNADLGEEVTDDAALLAVVTSANVACGYHAGIGGDHARGLRRGGSARGRGRRPGVVRRPARTSAGSPGTWRTTCCASRWPTRSACCPRSPRRRARRCATSSRTARSTTGCSTTRSRRAAVLDGSGRLPVLGHAGAAADAGRGGRAGGVPRGLPRPRLHRRTAGWCRAPSPGRWSRSEAAIVAQALALAAGGRLGLPARRQPGAVEPRGRRTPGAGGGRVRRSSVRVTSTGLDRILWSVHPCCGWTARFCG